MFITSEHILKIRSVIKRTCFCGGKTSPTVAGLKQIGLAFSGKKELFEIIIKVYISK